ncbi:tetratricopeptide repeat protein [Schlesneria paludicola]|uniref:tetratricopeptide repeat protein n=1 Tax=Schlesneria paludicola TaxID=360056 RepID=UPI00029B375B|nr:tetratricopeptide repeat protein [Schlesneria paludicola]
MTTANQHPVASTPTGQASASVADASKTGKEMTAEVAPAKRNVTFPLILTILAIFPIAVGVGVARVKASAAATARAHAAEHHEDPTTKVDPHLQRADRRIGDREFLARRYEVALRYFQKLGSDDPVRQLPELQYRIALCQEGLGLWDDALSNLQIVSGNTSDPTLKAAAIYGQARLFIRKNDPKSAEGLLRSLEFQTNGQGRLPRTMQHEIDYLLPITLAHRSVEGGVPGFEDAVPPLGELLVWSLEAAIEWADGQTGSDDPSLDASRPANALRCQVKKTPMRVGDVPLIIAGMVEVDCRNQSIKSILEGLAAECGWKVDWSDVAHDPLLARPVSMESENRPISLTLTILASELRATWTLEGDQLTVSRTDPDGVRARRMMDLTMTSLQAWIPIHRLCEAATFLRALIAHCEGVQPKATQYYLSLVGRESTPVAIRSAYNLASIYVRDGEYERAGFQLHYVVDGAPGHSLHTASLLQLGRLLMDMGEAQDASFQFRRATETVNHPHEQARGAVLLGMAYLKQEKYQQAAEAMLTFKPLFDEPDVRMAAAFVTSYARWFSISEDLREREAVFLYRSLIALQPRSEWLGQTGQLLIGRAFMQLGFDDQTSTVYLQTLKGRVTDAIRSEMTYLLADLDGENGRAESAKERWKTLIDGTSVEWSNRARLRLAEIALNEANPEECLEQCQAIVNHDGISVRDLHRAMGRAYEALGNDAMAARCYAGQSPK